MSINQELQNRSKNICELCSSEDENLMVYAVPPKDKDNNEHVVILCNNCNNKIINNDYTDSNYWRFLTGSIWSEVPAVQTLSYKILSKLKPAEWALETVDSVYLEESLIEWANAEDELEAAKIVHKDSYGVVLENGDSVILTQNLNVKGANFIAPKGKMVRKIRLVPDNAEQIEGKIEGDTIVILTKYIRKSI
ncbi:MAG: PhnA domain-containing protein [Nitrosarchaeum sp.]|nr:PhnA domain-containing protein [Nitrosarchaeum sp.]